MMEAVIAYENKTCSCCEAKCQADQGKTFMVNIQRGFSVAEWVFIFLCDFCLMDENEPIPYRLTSKGFVVGMLDDKGGEDA